MPLGDLQAAHGEPSNVITNIPTPPPKNPSSPFASFSGHHVGIRVPDYDAAKAWYTEKLDFRVLLEWPYGELKLAYLCPPNDDNFHVELLAGPVPFPNEVLDDLGVSLQHGGYQHMCVHVDYVDEARAELASRGVDLIGEPFEIEDISRRLAESSHRHARPEYFNKIVRVDARGRDGALLVGRDRCVR
ncbi:VOC family protein [Streptomyces sp. NPDC046759]|uniref:VOC family protein n=1 Tax=Streptomyces sp. NPDC046759 TaxID=3155019 RepID=UPI0033F55D97